MLGDDRSQRWYFMQTDQWYLERRIYLAVGININIASLLVLFLTPRLMLFTAFVGGAMVWFAGTGIGVMANGVYWLGAEPRLNPDHAPSDRCPECGLSEVCVGGRLHDEPNSQLVMIQR